MNSVSISVVLCTFNGGIYLKEQLDSLINQSFPPYEILIQDDMSTDNTWDIIQDYSTNYPYITAYRNAERLGLNQNFLSAFFKSSGDYIAISDQDDVWKQDKLELYIRELKDSNDCFVYSDSFITDSELNITGTLRVPEYDLIDLIWMGLSPGHSVLFRKDILMGVHNINDIDFIYDWLIALAALSVGEIKKVAQPTTFWRRHNTTVGRQDFKKRPQYEYVKPFTCCVRVFKSLFSGEKLENFSWQFENIYLILKNFEDRPNVKLLNKFIHHYRKARPLDMIMACFIYFRIHQRSKTKGLMKSVYIPIYKYYYYRYTGMGLRG